MKELTEKLGEINDETGKIIIFDGENFTCRGMREMLFLQRMEDALDAAAELAVKIDCLFHDGVYISFSGGKDSTVLLHIAREMYRNIGAVYVDTGLEYPEVREFVKQHENVEIIRPKMNFRQIIIKYGYPMIGKEVAACVYGARRYLEKLTEQEKNAGSSEVIPNYSYIADLIGIDRREDMENATYQSLSRGEIPSTHIKMPVRYLILQGKYVHKENGVETSEYSKMYNKERYKFFLDAPFEISDHCCSIMKKAPMYNYAKKQGKESCILSCRTGRNILDSI